MLNHSKPSALPSTVAMDVYSTHRGSQIQLLPVRDLSEVRELAEVYASQKQDTLLRVFGPRFVTSFSVLNGSVTEHADVTIPAAHW